MNQLEQNSRQRSSASRNTRSTSGGRRTAASSYSGSRASRTRSSSSGRRGRRRKGPDYTKIAIIGVILIIVIACISLLWNK